MAPGEPKQADEEPNFKAVVYQKIAQLKVELEWLSANRIIAHAISGSAEDGDGFTKRRRPGSEQPLM